MLDSAEGASVLQFQSCWLVLRTQTLAVEACLMRPRLLQDMKEKLGVKADDESKGEEAGCTTRLAWGQLLCVWCVPGRPCVGALD